MREKLEKIYYTIIVGYGICDTLFGTCYILILYQSGVTMTQISILMALVGIVGFIFDFPSGIVCDILGRKRIAGAGFALWAIGFITFAISKKYIIFLCIAIIMSIATAMISGAPISWYVESLKKLDCDDKLIDISIQRGQTLVRIGNICAALLGSILVKIGIRMTLVIAAIISVCISFVSIFCGADNKGNYKGTFSHNVSKLIHDFFGTKQLVEILLFMILEIIPFQLFIMSWQVLLTDNMALDATFVGILLAIFMLSQFLGNTLSAKLIKHYKASTLVGVGIVFSFIGFIIMTSSIFCNIIIVFILGAIIYEFGLSLEQVNGVCMIQAIIDGNSRSTFTSAISAVLSFLCFFINIILGIILEKLNFELVYGMMILIYIIAFAFFYRKFLNSELVSNDIK